MDGGGTRALVFGKDVGVMIGFLEECRVVEVGRGHSGDTVSEELDDDGEGAAKKGNMLEGQGEDSDVENRLRKFTMTVGAAAEKDKCRTEQE